MPSSERKKKLVCGLISSRHGRRGSGGRDGDAVRAARLSRRGAERERGALAAVESGELVEIARSMSPPMLPSVKDSAIHGSNG
jgi:hypothetical protein